MLISLWGNENAVTHEPVLAWSPGPLMSPLELSFSAALVSESVCEFVVAVPHLHLHLHVRRVLCSLLWQRWRGYKVRSFNVGILLDDLCCFTAFCSFCTLPALSWRWCNGMGYVSKTFTCCCGFFLYLHSGSRTWATPPHAEMHARL